MGTGSSAGDLVIIGAARTPIGKLGGGLASVSAPALGATAIKAALHRAHIAPDSVDEVLMGCVISAGQGQAPARQAALAAGVPHTVGATTLNKVCGSGLKTAMVAAAMIKAGDAQCIVAGGMESMSKGPYLLPQARFGHRLGHGQIVDSVVQDGLWCAARDHHMGLSAEWIARENGLTRVELDEWALRSHALATKAWDEGLFDPEVVPVEVTLRHGRTATIATDEYPRRDTSLEALARLRPAFQEDGLVTAGNASGISDGAAALVITSRSAALDPGTPPLARIIGYDQVAVEPLKLFTAPALAIQKLAMTLGRSVESFDLFEINEAFAPQTVANIRSLDLDQDRVNVNGGAIALGHPIGCSGARVLVTLLYALRQRSQESGIAAVCLGGGEAVAMAIETEN